MLTQKNYIHLKKLITLTNKLLCILQNKPYKYPIKNLCHNFDTLAIPPLHIYQLLIHVHKFLNHKRLLPTAFANYFTINSAVYLYSTRVRENLHLVLLLQIMEKELQNIKLVNVEQSALKEFFKNFSNKLKKVPTSSWNRYYCLMYYIDHVCVSGQFIHIWEISSVSVSLSSVCLCIVYMLF